MENSENELRVMLNNMIGNIIPIQDILNKINNDSTFLKKCYAIYLKIAIDSLKDKIIKQAEKIRR